MLFVKDSVTHAKTRVLLTVDLETKEGWDKIGS